MTWDIALLAVGLVVAVVLVMGPALWSSTTDTVLGRMWRRITGRDKR